MPTKNFQNDFQKQTQEQTEKIVKKEHSKKVYLIIVVVFIAIILGLLVGVFAVVKNYDSGSCMKPINKSDCVKEGERFRLMTFPIKSSKKNKQCCEGLKYHNVYSDKDCNISSRDIAVCINCPNGKCGLGENKCNCPEDCGKEIDTSNWQTYQNEEFGFEVRYPKEWYFTKLPRNGALISAPEILLGTDANPGISIFLTVINNPLKLSIPDWKNENDKQYNREIIFSKENKIVITGEEYIQYIDIIQATKEELETGYLKPKQTQYQRTNIYIGRNDNIYNIQWREADNAIESELSLLRMITKTFKFID